MQFGITTYTPTSWKHTIENEIKMVAWRPKKLYVPSNMIRIFEWICSFLAVLLVISWNSRGVTFSHLNKGDVNIVNSLNFFIAIATMSLVVATAVCVLIVVDLKVLLTPLMDGILNVVFCLFWLVSSVLLSIKLASIAESVTVREMDLHFSGLEIASSFGFLCVTFYGGGVWFAAMMQRRPDESPIRHTRMSAQLHSDDIMM